MTLKNLVSKLSMIEKRFLSYGTACKIAYTPDDGVRDLEDDENDLVWAIVDFCYSLMDKIESGQCSLQAQLDFDPIEYEKVIESDIYELEKLLSKYNILLNFDDIYQEIEEWRLSQK